MIFLTNDQIDIAKWNAVLKRSNFVTPFQMPDYYQYIKEINGYDAQVIALQNEDEYKALVVVTVQKESGIKSCFSKRGIIFGGPILDEPSYEELFFFLDKLSLYLKSKVIYIESRNFYDFSKYSAVFRKCGWVYQPYLNFRLLLNEKTKEDLLKSFTSGRRREIKQSLAEGATYAKCIDSDEIKQIYSILRVLYSQRVKLPLPPLDFFIGMHNCSLFQVFAVKHLERIIGGSFCLVLPGQAIFTYYYCGLRDYHKKIFPTHLAVFAAMDYAIENQLQVIDFMGAGQPGNEYGVRNYKAQFGGELVEFGRWRKILKPILYKLGVLGINALKKW